MRNEMGRGDETAQRVSVKRSGHRPSQRLQLASPESTAKIGAGETQQAYDAKEADGVGKESVTSYAERKA
jgi:hypothetical protein